MCEEIDQEEGFKKRETINAGGKDKDSWDGSDRWIKREGDVCAERVPSPLSGSSKGDPCSSSKGSQRRGKNKGKARSLFFTLHVILFLLFFGEGEHQAKREQQQQPGDSLSLFPIGENPRIKVGTKRERESAKTEKEDIKGGKESREWNEEVVRKERKRPRTSHTCLQPTIPSGSISRNKPGERNE